MSQPLKYIHTLPISHYSASCSGASHHHLLLRWFNCLLTDLQVSVLTLPILFFTESSYCSFECMLDACYSSKFLLVPHHYCEREEKKKSLLWFIRPHAIESSLFSLNSWSVLHFFTHFYALFPPYCLEHINQVLASGLCVYCFLSLECLPLSYLNGSSFHFLQVSVQISLCQSS